MKLQKLGWASYFKFELLKTAKDRYCDDVIAWYVKYYELWDERGYNKRDTKYNERILKSVRKEKRVKKELLRRDRIRTTITGKYTSKLHRYMTSMAMRLCRRTEKDKENVRLTMQLKADNIYKTFNKENYKIVCKLRNRKWSYQRIHEETGIPYVSVARYIRLGMDKGIIKLEPKRELTPFHLYES